jgi:ATP-dependent RNA circularization protein (DNA/RNA ligase family)
MDAKIFLKNRLIVEEKVDGANIGISLDSAGRLRVQNRGNYLNRESHLQFQTLWVWLDCHRDLLIKNLESGLILFGEWCFARHSKYYDALPDWFLLFDVYDRNSGDFWAASRRSEMAVKIGLSQVPTISEGFFSKNKLLQLLGPSKIGNTPMEGVYLRVDDDLRLMLRAKIVRADFSESIKDHWSAKPIEKNTLKKVAYSTLQLAQR